MLETFLGLVATDYSTKKETPQLRGILPDNALNPPALGGLVSLEIGLNSVKNHCPDLNHPPADPIFNWSIEKNEEKIETQAGELWRTPRDIDIDQLVHQRALPISERPPNFGGWQPLHPGGSGQNSGQRSLMGKLVYQAWANIHRYIYYLLLMS
ncbi:hypothetical protein P167DRAFT_547968 [Morchella conica CCBAS932]|uniref:Uncharacterized protein n=1 Tax=Morchella conica CCBAS932 TaxID=1392247 RepID=A0A3N4KJP5_9PEZI|nr:hypothetical protein P167DRAFT_547968 [Morchella conica CCBAS932]